MSFHRVKTGRPHYESLEWAKVSRSDTKLVGVSLLPVRLVFGAVVVECLPDEGSTSIDCRLCVVPHSASSSLDEPFIEGQDRVFWNPPES